MKDLRLILASGFSVCLSPLIAQLTTWVDYSEHLIHDHCARYHQEGGAGPFYLLMRMCFYTTPENSHVMQEGKMLPYLADPLLVIK